MDDTEKLSQLTRLCQAFGADHEQAATMAAQLIKRSEQLAQERNITEVQALDYLLRLLKSGREGVAPPHLPPSGGSSPIEN